MQGEEIGGNLGISAAGRRTVHGGQNADDQD